MIVQNTTAYPQVYTNTHVMWVDLQAQQHKNHDLNTKYVTGPAKINHVSTNYTYLHNNEYLQFPVIYVGYVDTYIMYRHIIRRVKVRLRKLCASGISHIINHTTKSISC